MRSHRLWVLITLATALAGCSSSGTLSRYTHETPEAAGMYLDGTGPTADAADARREAARQVQPEPAQPAPVRRPTRTTRAEDLSARTTGSRAQAGREAPKPYSEEWWDREKREDARLKQKMIICQGC